MWCTLLKWPPPPPPRLARWPLNLISLWCIFCQNISKPDVKRNPRWLARWPPMNFEANLVTVRNMKITLQTVSLNPDTIGSGHIVKNEFSLKSKMAAKITLLNIMPTRRKTATGPWSASGRGYSSCSSSRTRKYRVGTSNRQTASSIAPRTKNAMPKPRTSDNQPEK